MFEFSLFMHDILTEWMAPPFHLPRFGETPQRVRIALQPRDIPTGTFSTAAIGNMKNNIRRYLKVNLWIMTFYLPFIIYLLTLFHVCGLELSSACQYFKSFPWCRLWQCWAFQWQVLDLTDWLVRWFHSWHLAPGAPWFPMRSGRATDWKLRDAVPLESMTIDGSQERWKSTTRAGEFFVWPSRPSTLSRMFSKVHRPGRA